MYKADALRDAISKDKFWRIDCTNHRHERSRCTDAYMVCRCDSIIVMVEPVLTEHQWVISKAVALNAVKFLGVHPLTPEQDGYQCHITDYKQAKLHVKSFERSTPPPTSSPNRMSNSLLRLYSTSTPRFKCLTIVVLRIPRENSIEKALLLGLHCMHKMRTTAIHDPCSVGISQSVLLDNAMMQPLTQCDREKSKQQTVRF